MNYSKIIHLNDFGNESDTVKVWTLLDFLNKLNYLYSENVLKSYWMNSGIQFNLDY